MDQSSLVRVLSVPWDVTSTYRSGSHQSPRLIQSVMHQLDSNHPFSDHQFHFEFLSPDPRIYRLQKAFKDSAVGIIEALNMGRSLSGHDISTRHQINDASVEVAGIVFESAQSYLDAPLILCGGEHGVGLGYIRALASKYSNVSVLHLDAHMDCHESYFGFNYSHASVMTHYSAIETISSITQVGIRDYDQKERAFQEKSSTNFHVFDDYALHQSMFEGLAWKDTCDRIIGTLSDTVFISLDVDVLMAYLCPRTGTPVPGGLSYNQLVYLLDQISQSKTVIGSELVEVNIQGDNDWDANVGARLLQLLSGCYS